MPRLAAFAIFLLLGASRAADLNPAAINIQLPGQLKWTVTRSGANEAVLFGDPSKSGYPCVERDREHKVNNDRF